jgi:hypothetical protein
MLNFALGTLAGGMIAVVALAVGLRQPAVLERLDLAPRVSTPLAVAKRSEPACPPGAASAGAPGVRAAQTESLFAPRRFWFVAP